MLVSEVRVQNYKSIQDSGWVNLEENITTLLGRNESGKTSFLQAISSFSDSEEYDSEDMCIYTGHSADDRVPIVSIRFMVEESDTDGEDVIDIDIFTGSIEIGDCISVTKFSNGDKEITSHDMEPTTEDEESIEQLFSELRSTHREILEDMNSRISSLSSQYGGNFRNHANNQLTQQINESQSVNFETLSDLSESANSVLKVLNETPEQNDEITEFKKEYENNLESNIASIDDVMDLQAEIRQHHNKRREFFDILPLIIYYEEVDIIEDEINVSSVTSDKHETFRNLLDIVGVDPSEIEQMNNVERLQRLDEAEGEIQGKVNKLWDQKTVSVEINYVEDSFIVLIKDEELPERSVRESEDVQNAIVDRGLIRPSGRSKGFQWFFSFYINLNAVTQKSADENTIVLLDDPAVYLHPKGKKNWLTAIEDLAENNQIVYSSHSPFLIRKEYPSRIRLVEDQKERGTQVNQDFHTSDSMTLEPLRNALGIGLGDSPFVSKRKILVEGITDYYIIIGLADYFREYLNEDILNWEEVTVMPTNGGNSMVRAAKWVASEEFSYALLLDNDQKGKQVERDIRNHHPEIDLDRVFLLSKDDSRQDYQIEIEDLFCPTFYIDCLNKAYSTKFEGFEEVTINQTGDVWEISEVEYKGRKITSKINEVFDRRDDGELDKVLVSNEIRDRLMSGREIQESDVKFFREILGRLRNVT